MNSLGIDFGTSNCLAHVATPNDVFPVELESGSFSLPSVVFTARREVAMRQVEDSEFEKRLRQARLEERKRGGRALDETELQRAIRDAMRREAADEANKSYWDQTFFSLLKDGQAILFGTPALRAYFSDPLSGVLVKSPKSFLGSKISQNHLTHFENIVTAMLEHIRSVAETAHDCTITSAVLGRPVRYHGTQGRDGDTQALDVMSRAAARAARV